MSDEQSLDLVRVLSERRDRSRSRRVVLSASLAAVLVGIIGGGLFASGSWGFLDDPPAPPAQHAAAVAEPSKAAVAPKVEATAVDVAKVEAPAQAPPAPPAAAVVAAKADDPPSKKKRRDRDPPKKEEPKAVEAPPAPPPPAPVEVAKPAEPARGTLQVGASRWVDIYVNGVKLGRAPDQNKYSLPVGTYKLRAVNPHCVPLEREITISADATTRERLTIECP